MAGGAREWLPSHALPAQARALLQAAVLDGSAGSAAALVCVGRDFQAGFAFGRTSRVRQVPAGGREQPRPGVPIDLETRFDLASLTKPMATTTLLARELSRGQPSISLSDRVDRHLPEADAGARTATVGSTTLQAVLGHGAGLPAWQDFWTASQTLDPAERCTAIMREVLTQPLTTPSGTHVIYSDLGYLTLGWLLEALHRTPLDQLFAREIAAPLGLRAGYRRSTRSHPPEPLVATEITPERCPEGRPLQGVVHDDNCAALAGVAGHAGLFASAIDVASWATVWLDVLAGDPGDATPRGRLALAPAVAHRLVTAQAAPGTTWRLGWDTPTRPGSSAGELAPADAFGHLGFTGTSVWLAPAAQAAVVLLTNRVHPSREATEGIRRLRPALHDSVWPWLQR